MRIKITECPRDAMQGIKAFIPTEKKVEYINKLLKVGFFAIDFGSFVSPKAIPQMADTALVLSKLDLSEQKSKLSVIVANKRGAIDACFFNEIYYLGYPFSVSETFQLKNTNKTIADSFETVKAIKDLADKHNKKVLIYLSMGFGNPYGDDWNVDLVGTWVEKLVNLGITEFMLSDTIGMAEEDDIKYIFRGLNEAYPKIEFGAHFHSTPSGWKDKIKAAVEAGCKRFDGAIRGFGGCPMAKDDLIGNIPTEKLVEYFKAENHATGVYSRTFDEAVLASTDVFG